MSFMVLIRKYIWDRKKHTRNNHCWHESWWVIRKSPVS
jgi:hypothetical protein